MNRIKNLISVNKGYILKKSWQCVRCFFSLLGMLAILIPINSLLADKLLKCMPLTCQALVAILIIFLVWIFCFIGYGVKVLFLSNRIKVFSLNNGKGVYLKYGDLFDKNILINPTEYRNIVIPVNRCFDTLVDNDLVSDTTLHGIAMKMLYSNKQYNRETLNEAIQNNLERNRFHVEETLSEDQKRSGNLKRYQVGSVAEIESSDSCKLFFLALSTFDKDLCAHTTREEYMIALIRLLEFCNKRSQGKDVVMPLMGTHLSRTNLTERQALECMVHFLRIHKDLLHGNIYIVISEKLKEVISIADFKEEWSFWAYMP